MAQSSHGPGSPSWALAPITWIAMISLRHILASQIVFVFVWSPGNGKKCEPWCGCDWKCGISEYICKMTMFNRGKYDQPMNLGYWVLQTNPCGFREKRNQWSNQWSNLESTWAKKVSRCCKVLPWRSSKDRPVARCPSGPAMNSGTAVQLRGASPQPPLLGDPLEPLKVKGWSDDEAMMKRWNEAMKWSDVPLCSHFSNDLQFASFNLFQQRFQLQILDEIAPWHPSDGQLRLLQLTGQRP